VGVLPKRAPGPSRAWSGAALSGRSVTVGIGVGALSSVGLGSAVFATFVGGTIEQGVEAGAIDAGGVLALGGLGKYSAGKIFPASTKLGLGEKLARKAPQASGVFLGKLGARAIR